MFRRELPPEIIRELLETGRTAEPLDFVSRAGKPYTARLVLEEGQVKPEFVNDRAPRTHAPEHETSSGSEIPDEAAPSCNTGQPLEEARFAHNDFSAMQEQSEDSETPPPGSEEA